MTEVVQQNSPGVNVAFPSLVLFAASSLDHLPQRVKMEERRNPVGWWEYNRHTRCQAAASPLIPTNPYPWFLKLEGKIKLSKLAFYHWGEAKRRRIVCFALVKKNCQTPSVSLSTELHHFRSFCGLLHKDYMWMGGEVNIINIFVVSANARKLWTLTRNIPLIGHGHGGVGGSKVCLMTTLNHRPKKISSPLLLISSNDVPVGWRALCQPYCHYNVPFSLLLLFCVTEWMFHATKFASTSSPPAHQLTAIFISHMRSMTSPSTEMQQP